LDPARRSSRVSGCRWRARCRPAVADTFPSRAITIVVPSRRADDRFRRPRVGERMATVLSQSVVLENVTGGGSTIATGRVAHAAPTGTPSSSISWRSPQRDPPQAAVRHGKGADGIGLVNFSPMVLVAARRFPPTAWRR